MKEGENSSNKQQQQQSNIVNNVNTITGSRLASQTNRFGFKLNTKTTNNYPLTTSNITTNTNPISDNNTINNNNNSQTVTVNQQQIKNSGTKTPLKEQSTSLVNNENHLTTPTTSTTTTTTTIQSTSNSVKNRTNSPFRSLLKAPMNMLCVSNNSNSSTNLTTNVVKNIDNKEIKTCSSILDDNQNNQTTSSNQYNGSMKETKIHTYQKLPVSNILNSNNSRKQLKMTLSQQQQNQPQSSVTSSTTSLSSISKLKTCNTIQSSQSSVNSLGSGSNVKSSIKQVSPRSLSSSNKQQKIENDVQTKSNCQQQQQQHQQQTTLLINANTDNSKHVPQIQTNLPQYKLFSQLRRTTKQQSTTVNTNKLSTVKQFSEDVNCKLIDNTNNNTTNTDNNNYNKAIDINHNQNHAEDSAYSSLANSTLNSQEIQRPSGLMTTSTNLNETSHQHYHHRLKPTVIQSTHLKSFDIEHCLNGVENCSKNDDKWHISSEPSQKSASSKTDISVQKDTNLSNDSVFSNKVKNEKLCKTFSFDETLINKNLNYDNAINNSSDISINNTKNNEDDNCINEALNSLKNISISDSVNELNVLLASSTEFNNNQNSSKDHNTINKNSSNSIATTVTIPNGIIINNNNSNNLNSKLRTCSVSAIQFKPPSNLPLIDNCEYVQIDIEMYRNLVEDLQSTKIMLYKLMSILKEDNDDNLLVSSLSKKKYSNASIQTDNNDKN